MTTCCAKPKPNAKELDPLARKVSPPNTPSFFEGDIGRGGRPSPPPLVETAMKARFNSGRCKHCGDSADAHAKGECVVCGCVKLETRERAAREHRQRVWIAKVEFFVKNRWIGEEVRVKAMGHVGAAMKAVREAKRLALKPRTRVAQLRITLIPVPKSRGGERRE